MDRLIYNVFLHTVAAPFLAAYYLPRVLLGRKYRNSLGGKLGYLPKDFVPERIPKPRVWFHAVSVGEVVALGPLIKAVRDLEADVSPIVSTGTETGQAKARESIPESEGFLYLPLDFPACVDPTIQRIRPQLFVLMETELWPNLIHGLKSAGSAVALANGRISDRSFPRYRKLKSIFASTLARIDLFLMASDTDAQRIEEMGAPGDRIHVTGNTKFDAALGRVPVEAEVRIREMFDLDVGTRVVVAGSTHPGEHELVLDAYNKLTETYPDLILILVPRHVEKTPSIVAAMKDRNMQPPFLRSTVDDGEKRNGRRVVIVDRTGELFQVFSVASAVFMGGSLVPKGGQNILEPAAWGKMVLFGPSMEDFREARDILVAAGAGIPVSGLGDLTRKLHDILSAPEPAAARGAAGRESILKHVGSARRNAEMLMHLLKSGGPVQQRS
jgi:3-deoxy-D-manno-octulosonic-acid transferase